MAGLFIMKGVAPPDTTMGDIYKAGLPFLGCEYVRNRNELLRLDRENITS